MDATRDYRTTVKSKNKKRSMTKKKIQKIKNNKKRESNKISLPFIDIQLLNICTQVSGQMTPLCVYLIGGELSVGLQI